MENHGLNLIKFISRWTNPR